MGKIGAKQFSGNATSRSRRCFSSRAVHVFDNAKNGRSSAHVSGPNPAVVDFLDVRHEARFNILSACRMFSSVAMPACVGAETIESRADRISIRPEAFSARLARTVDRLGLVDFVVNLKVAVRTQKHESLRVRFGLGDCLDGTSFSVLSWCNVMKLQRAARAVVSAALTASTECLNERIFASGVRLRSCHIASALYGKSHIIGIVPHTV